ncbi:unnamed protein product [Oppiella nova]|uniref:Uncharacterized protein n=1 Tax=Oppiella nova TaxID=334625 RepID=A0A7R9QW14_9ACAR|nr:unnamed protein product [Oppiella nova]CAG2176436.1 unnamed protein product [Oppiella nova]
MRSTQGIFRVFVCDLC